MKAQITDNRNAYPIASFSLIYADVMRNRSLLMFFFFLVSIDYLGWYSNKTQAPIRIYGLINLTKNCILRPKMSTTEIAIKRWYSNNSLEKFVQVFLFFIYVYDDSSTQVPLNKD